MVARPPVRLVIERMTHADLAAVQAIEKASFTTPWPSYAYRNELETNRLAHYLVVRAGREVIGYAGVWLMVDEAHVTTFAVAPAWRRRRDRRAPPPGPPRPGDRARARARRRSRSASRTWARAGSTRSTASGPVGIRPRYYSDDHEDALIMTTEPLAGPAMTARLAALRAELAALPEPEAPAMSGGLLLAVESSCDETGVALLDGPRRIVAQAVASQVALHAGTGGIVPELAARAHLRWLDPALDEVLADAGATLADVGRGRRHRRARAWSARSSSASRTRRRWPGRSTCRSSGVNHLEGHLYAAWLLDPGEAERPEPAFPLVALVVSGGHTFLVEMRDHLAYRLLGETVDDAAGEAFDKAGRLLGLGYPGGPAIAAAAADARRARRAAAPGLAGRLVRLQLLRASRPPSAASSRRSSPPAGLPSAEDGGPPACVARRRAGGGLPGERRRRPRHQDAAGGRGDGRPGDRRRRRRGLERRAARPPRGRGGRPRRRPRRSRGPGSAPTTGR